MCLIDLGTNGEIVVGNRERMLCASTAAGPAFEGGRISMGMRAATGAISQVRRGPDGLRCHVLGDVPPRGICGSGLVDAVAVGLELGVIAPNGRLANGPWTVQAPVALTQEDVRQLQLAKAAIAAGVRVLLGRLGWTPGDISRVHLAGAFGNYVSAGERPPHRPVAVRRRGHLSGGEHGLARRQAGAVRRCAATSRRSARASSTCRWRRTRRSRKRSSTRWGSPLPQVELLHLVAQGVAGDLEQAGGLGLVAVGLLEGADQQRPLAVLERHAFVGDRRRGGARRGPASRRTG